MSRDRYDIVIAGGGMIGTCLALALRSLSLKIAIVEAVAPRQTMQPSFDDRSTALSRSTQRMFAAMGIWPEIRAASTAIERIHVSDKGRFGLSHIDARQEGVEALGYVVINRVLGDVLRRHLNDAPDLDVFCPHRIVDAAASEHGAIVTLETGTALSSDLLIVADGANSTTRELLGIAAQRTDYAQRAVIGNLLTERALDACAFERFTSQGPLALLPIADARAAFVWTVSETQAERVLALSDETFIAELQSEFGLRLGAFSRIGKRASYPLALSRALRLTAPHCVLVGNAAHALHPVSAQGFNLGLRDVAAICDCILDANAAGTNIGAASVLDRYSDWRRSDQKKLVHFTDSLVRLFASQRPLVRAARTAGMLGFDLIPGVRSLFAKHTMGLAGDLPRLSRGVPLS